MSRASEPNGTPTMADLTRMVMQLRTELQNTRGTKLKVPLPDQFDGTRGRLKNFLAQADTYLKYNSHLLPSESDKVTLIGSRLTGAAFNFYQPYYNDFTKYDSDQQEDATKKLFGNYNLFRERLTQQFGNIDEKREAERKIVNLRQTGSMAHYVSEFQQLLGHLNWADGPAIVQFYQGMKEDVKDQFMLIDRPTEITEMQMKAIEIDNRLYERRLEKRGRQTFHHGKENKKTWKKMEMTTAMGTHSGPMEIDSVNQVNRQDNRKEHKKKPLTDQQKKWLAEKACIKCGQQGHWANKCTTKEIKMVKKTGNLDQEEIKHAYMHWTACYDDECDAHRTSKDNAGWMPSKPQALSKEEIANRQAQYHASLSGRKCGNPKCEVKHHREWSEEVEALEKEHRHRQLSKAQCLRNRCEHHGKGTKQVAKVAKQEENVPYIETQAIINGTAVTALIDSGSHCNLIDPGTVKDLGLRWEPKTYPYRVSGADGTALNETGLVTAETAVVTYHIQDQVLEGVFDIMPMGSHVLMFGMPWLREHNPYIDWAKGTIQFGLPPPVYGKSVMQIKIEEIPADYQDLAEAFKELTGKEALPEHQEWDHTIPLKEGTKPHMEPIRRMDESQAKELREFLNDRLSKGWIEESSSSAGYPILFVPKKDGKKRLCVDYRRLNDITMKDSHPLPLISEIQDRIAKATIFTKLDIKDAYHQVRIKEGEEWKTAFRTRYGTYQWKVMPFGLTNAPASFQRLINTALKDYLDVFCTAYLDDIIIFSRNQKEHVEHVRKVIQRLIQWNLRLKLEKCEFGVVETEFLGHILRPGQIDMDPKKTQSIQEWKTPTTVKEVQSFLGLGNYYRKFIRDYSKIAKPLTDLGRTGNVFRWEKQHEASFKALKQAFTTAPVLQLYDPDKAIVIETDASDYALGAVLNQMDDKGRLRPVAFHSRKFIAAEINYDVHDKELLAIVEAMKVWAVYVNSNPHEIHVYTDHKNLQTFLTTKELTRRHMRWAERLGHVKFRIIYRKGTENARADALSRRIDYKPDAVEQLYRLLEQDVDGSLVYANPQVMQVYRVAQEVDQELIDAYRKDSMYVELKARSGKEGHIHETPDGYMRYYGKVYVPTRQVDRIVRQAHDAPGAGHQGWKKTHERLKSHYYFPKMKERVREHIDTCMECIINKPSRHKPYGEMGEYRIPEEPFEEVAMDWITKLPLSMDPLTKTKYDSIMVIVDRLTKYAKFIPYLEKSSTEALAHSFTQHIIADHGMPKGIISDRDKWLTSNFWKSLMKNLGSKQIMTSAYHPQANGQAERLNQTLEQYLRHYLNYRQNNWVELLPIAQYAYNSSYSDGMGVTPFEALFGRTPTMYNEPLPDPRPAQEAGKWTERAKESQEQLRLDLEFLRIKMAKYYDQTRLSAPILRKGEKVFLLRKNLKTKRPSDKLDHVKIGPLQIKNRIGRLHYELELPETMKVHPVFHVALLEPAPASIPLMKRLTVESDEDTYEVEKIVMHQEDTHTGHYKYLVKWKGYSYAENTWEPEENFFDKTILRQYHRELGAAKKTNLQGSPSRATQKAQAIKQKPRPNYPVRRVLMVQKIQWEEHLKSPERQLPPPISPSPQSTPTLGRTSPSPEMLNDWHPFSNAIGELREYVSGPALVHAGPLGQRTFDPPQRAPTPHPGILPPEPLGDQTRPLGVCSGSTLGQPTLEEKIERLLRHRQNAIDEWQEMPTGPESEELYEQIESIGQHIDEQIRHLQSLAVTTKSHLVLRDKHSAQFPEPKSTKQRRPDFRQEEQGEGISHSLAKAASARSSRRSRADFLGMTGQKRKRDNILEGGSTNYLYPREQSQQGYDGYRDAILEEEGAVLRQD